MNRARVSPQISRVTLNPMLPAAMSWIRVSSIGCLNGSLRMRCTPRSTISSLGPVHRLLHCEGVGDLAHVGRSMAVLVIEHHGESLGRRSLSSLPLSWAEA